MNLYDVIKKPVITESSMAQLEAGKYVFEVDTRAHKLLIKQAVEAAFEGVKAVSYTHLVETNCGRCLLAFGQVES